MSRYSISPLIILLLAQFLASASPAEAGDSIKAKLYSPNASEEAGGTLALDGYNLTGHLSGGGMDVTISGEVKASGVEVEVSGRILPSCSLSHQSMNGVAHNNGLNTSVELAFQCPTKANGYGGGEDYLFRLDLALPSPHLQVPTDPGEAADSGLRPSGEIQGNPA
jgi:hypothetical protein